MAAKYNPYVQRLIEDEELRENIVAGVRVRSRDAYARLSNGKSPTKQIFDDKKLQKDLKRGGGVAPRRDASRCTRRPKKQAQRGGFGKLLLSARRRRARARAVSEGLRKKVLDALFGAEEEFEYTSTTTASSPSPRTPARHDHADRAATGGFAEGRPGGRPSSFLSTGSTGMSQHERGGDERGDRQRDGDARSGSAACVVVSPPCAAASRPARARGRARARPRRTPSPASPGRSG